MIRVYLSCRECGYRKDTKGSEESLPTRCPSCGSSKLEFVVVREIREKPKSKERLLHEEGHGERIVNLVREAFLKQVAPGEWEVDLDRLMVEEVSLAEIEPGEYEIVFRAVKAPS